MSHHELPEHDALDTIDEKVLKGELFFERHGKKMNPLDVTLRDRARLLLISGPNAGGKSVCLKTVGLLQYMLQCGLPVPARETPRAGISTTFSSTSATSRVLRTTFRPTPPTCST